MSIEGARGSGWESAIHPDDRETYRRALDARDASSFELRIRGRDGAHRRFAVRGEPMDDDARGWFWTARAIDVLAGWVHAIPHLVWSARADGFTDFHNRRFLDYLGMSAEELHGDGWAGTLHPSDAPVAAEAWKRASESGTEFEAEFRIRRADGAYRWHISRASPYKDESGALSRWFGTCTDIDDRRRAEEAERDAQARFRATIENAPVGVAHVDLDGHFAYVNRAFCEIVGREPAELAGLRWQDITHPDDLDADVENARRAIRGEIPHYTMEKRFVRKDGKNVWVQLFGNFIRADDGAILRGVGVVVDVTARRHAEDRLSAVVASIDDHLVTFDHEWRYTYVNDAAARMLGKSREELIGRCIWELFPDAVGNQFYDELHRAARTGVPIRSEHYYAVWDRWLLNHVYPTADGVTCFSSDVTDKKRIEARFRAAVATSPLPMLIHAEDGAVVDVNRAWTTLSGHPRERITTIADWTELAYGERKEIARSVIDRLFEADGTTHEGEFTIRTASGESRVWDFRSAPLGRDELGRRIVLSIANDVTDQRAAEEKLRDADRRKDEFLAMLAHELRNPLAPIRTAVEVLGLSGVQPATAERCRATIQRQVTHMVRMVDDLLDVSRITQGKISLDVETLGVRDIVDAAIETARPALEAARHELVVDVRGNATVRGDRARLVQVVTNLLTNASKFTPPGGRVSVSAAQTTDGRVAITVRDTGIGIAKEAQSRIFDLFAQEHATLERARGGLGIGLTLAKRLVEMHRGTIGVESEGVGRGAAFTVAFPEAADEPTDQKAIRAAQRPARPLRIAIVEDNVDAAVMFKMLLEREGCEVTIANDGESGLRLLEQWSPEIALVDLGLPVLDGFSLARAVRKAGGKSPVLVAVSGYGHAEDKARARAAGFDEHMTKPVSMQQLWDLLERRLAVRPLPSRPRSTNA